VSGERENAEAKFGSRKLLWTLKLVTAQLSLGGYQESSRSTAQTPLIGRITS